MRDFRFAASLVALLGAGGAAAAHEPTSCRSYTIENVCHESGRPCHLHMVYAPGHQPNHHARASHWYGRLTGPEVRHVTLRQRQCWFEHKPEHRY